MDSESDDEIYDNVTLEAFDYLEVPEGSLIAAVYRNDLAEVINLINKGRSVNANDNTGYTSVHAAVKNENLEILTILLQQPEVNIDAQTHLGETPLFLSMKTSSSAFALKLLAHGADVTIPNLQMETPLHLSVRKFHDVSLELIKRKADVNAEDFNMYTPLREAAEHSDFEMISMLVYHGAMADVVDCNGLSPFMASLYVGANVEVQKLLMDLEVDYCRLTCDNVSTLLMAFLCKSPLCSELIDRGADVNYIHPTYNLVKLAFHSDEIFTKVWNKFDLKKAYTFSNRSPLVLVLMSVINTEWPMKTDLWVQRLETIFFSEKGMEMLLSLTNLEISMLFQKFLYAVRFLRITSSQLYKFLCIWLSCGVNCVHTRDVAAIYFTYGYVDAFELVTHMDIILDDSFYGLIIPYLICDVSGKNCINDLVRCFVESSSVDKEFYKVLEFGTPSERSRELFNKNKDSFLSDFPDWGQKIEERLKMLPMVPSLLELSRDSAKKAIIAKYDIKKCSLYYSILKWMPIPNVIKHILSYKVPVNKFRN